MHLKVALEVHHTMTDMNVVIMTGQALVMMREEVQDTIKITRGTVTMGEVLSVLGLSIIGDGKIGFPMGGNLMTVIVLMGKVNLKLGRQIAKRIQVCPAFLLCGLLGRYWGRMSYLFALVSLQEPIAAGLLMALKLPR